MSEEDKEQSKKSDAPEKVEKAEICENPLLCPEEWEEHPGEKVLGEYHKDGPASLSVEEADLESFEKYWNGKSEGSLTSEYHKEGAPHLHEPWMTTEEKAPQNQETEPVEAVKLAEPAEGERVAEAPKKEEAAAKVSPVEGPTIERPINIHTLEVLSYAVIRALFSQGITLPIKREGFIDMELRVRGKDVTIDTKELFPITVPELVIWRVIYAYKGKPVVELGRGVKKGLKIHAFRGLVMLVDIWRSNRRQRIMKKRAERANQGGPVG
ncbi:MAG: hypothetical protein LUO85_02225 [Methanomassiliicoccales archaeon]|nr:hypothetical protein [Methanomassiliicoccales archaeon]